MPAEELTREFGEGATAEEICARSIRALSAAGVRHFYVSNLPLGRAATTLERILLRALRLGVELGAYSPGALELILFLGEQHVEAGQRSVAAADVALQLDLHVFRQRPCALTCCSSVRSRLRIITIL